MKKSWKSYSTTDAMQGLNFCAKITTKRFKLVKHQEKGNKENQMQNQSCVRKSFSQNGRWCTQQKMFLQAGNFRSGARKPWAKEEERRCEYCSTTFWKTMGVSKMHTFASQKALQALCPMWPPAYKRTKKSNTFIVYSVSQQVLDVKLLVKISDLEFWNFLARKIRQIEWRFALHS